MLNLIIRLDLHNSQNVTVGTVSVLGVNFFGLWKHNFWWDIPYTESKLWWKKFPNFCQNLSAFIRGWSRRVMWHQQPLVTIPWQRHRDSAENSGTFSNTTDSVCRMFRQKFCFQSPKKFTPILFSSFVFYCTWKLCGVRTLPPPPPTKSPSPMEKWKVGRIPFIPILSHQILIILYKKKNLYDYIASELGHPLQSMKPMVETHIINFRWWLIISRS